jgi:hypothetical protein
MTFRSCLGKGWAGAKLWQHRFRLSAVFHEAKRYHAHIRGPLLTRAVLDEIFFKLLRQNPLKCLREQKKLIFKIIHYGL